MTGAVGPTNPGCDLLIKWLVYNEDKDWADSRNSFC